MHEEGSGEEEAGVVGALNAARLVAAHRGFGRGQEAVRPGAVVVRVDPRYYRPTETAVSALTAVSAARTHPADRGRARTSCGSGRSVD